MCSFIINKKIYKNLEFEIDVTGFILCITKQVLKADLEKNTHLMVISSKLNKH